MGHEAGPKLALCAHILRQRYCQALVLDLCSVGRTNLHKGPSLLGCLEPLYHYFLGSLGFLPLSSRMVGFFTGESVLKVIVWDWNPDIRPANERFGELQPEVTISTRRYLSSLGHSSGEKPWVTPQNGG